MKFNFRRIFSRDRRPTSIAFVLIAILVVIILGMSYLTIVCDRGQVDMQLVPENQGIVDTLVLPSNGPNDVEVQSDLSVFDLRTWKDVPLDLARVKPISPVNYTNYLRVKKQDSIDCLYAHYATSGLRIDFQCVTHEYRVLRKSKPRSYHSLQGSIEYTLQIDVSKEQLGRIFPIIVQATYWNAFRDLNREEASTYTESANVPEDLSLLILFPYSKPCKDVLATTATESGQHVPYLNFKDVFVDSDGQYAYWNIRSKEPDRHYQLSWTW